MTKHEPGPDFATGGRAGRAIVKRAMAGELAVLIVEDDAHVAVALEEALAAASPPIKVVRSCRSAAAASAAVADPALAFDVALVDLRLGDGSGVDVVRAIRASRPRAEPIVITSFADPPTVLSAIRAGARGYLLKDGTPAQVVASVRDAASGGAPMSPAIARLVLETVRGTEPQEEEAEATLTERERAVLALLCEGRTYREVATVLEIGVGTVQTRVKSIYTKLEVGSKAELAALAFRRGLVR